MVTPAARFCAQCGGGVTPTAVFCVNCGASIAPLQGMGPATGYATPHTAPPMQAYAAPHPYPVVYGPPPVTQGVAILALLLNIFVWPGLGSIVAKRNEGWAQGFIFLFGIPLTLLLIGIPMLIGAWIWALVTGIQLLQTAKV